jgi:hypothetical protein
MIAAFDFTSHTDAHVGEQALSYGVLIPDENLKMTQVSLSEPGSTGVCL